MGRTGDIEAVGAGGEADTRVEDGRGEYKSFLSDGDGDRVCSREILESLMPMSTM
jgi:hypothetical protein